MEAEALYLAIGEKIKGAIQSQMFGKPCFKINSKAFICFYKNCMVFKLTDAAHEAALNLVGAELFDPSGKGRPMKAWVQVPFEHAHQWKKLAKLSFDLMLSQTI